MEDRAVFTDAQGRFNLQDIPAGKIKLVVNGLTATNAPAGFYFPEMTMELNIRPGEPNTVMSAMQPDAIKQQAMTERGVYLPRLQTSLLNVVSNPQPTTVVVNALSAPDVSPKAPVPDVDGATRFNPRRRRFRSRIRGSASALCRRRWCKTCFPPPFGSNIRLRSRSRRRSYGFQHAGGYHVPELSERRPGEQGQRLFL